METPCAHPHRLETRKETSLTEFCYEIVNSLFSRNSHGIKVTFFSNTRTVQIAKFPKTSHFFNLRDSSFGRHVYAESVIRERLNLQ